MIMSFICSCRNKIGAALHISDEAIQAVDGKFAGLADGSHYTLRVTEDCEAAVAGRRASEENVYAKPMALSDEQPASPPPPPPRATPCFSPLPPGMQPPLWRQEEG